MNQTFVVVATLGMILAALLAISFTGGDTGVYIPAPLSPPHARFSAACDACHTPWQGADGARCLVCHDSQLAQDLHGADRLAKARHAPLYATMREVACVDCHREHRPTREGGYTGPDDLCVECHRMVEMVDLHPDMPGELTATGCRTAGCHRYHEAIPAPLLAEAEPIRIRKESRIVAPPEPSEPDPLPEEEMVAMRESLFYQERPIITARYEIGAHAGTKATCDACHLVKGKRSLNPPVTVCEECHEAETKTFVKGRHGAAEGFHLTGAKAPALHVRCGDCHDAHSLKTGKARKEACEGCHESPHAKAYEKSAHWRHLSEPNFDLSPLKAPDCAGCHMPRRASLGGAVDHNETLSTVAPERTATDVCLACHGLGFALSALLEERVVESNFTYAPTHIPAPLGYTLRRGKGAP